MPSVLEKVLVLPARWKKNAQTLRTRFGAAPTLEQQLKIQDYAEGAERLYEALSSLLEQLEAVETERLATEMRPVVPEGIEHADRNRRDSIHLLKSFKHGWEQPDALPGVGRSLAELFRPIDRKIDLQVKKST